MRTYKIGEAAALLNLKTYVLRFWETEFSQIKPLRTEKGQRLYSEEDVSLLRRIRHLLHDRGLTIEGARKALAESEARKIARERGAGGAAKADDANEDDFTPDAELDDSENVPPVRASAQRTLDAVKTLIAQNSQEPLMPQDQRGQREIRNFHPASPEAGVIGQTNMESAALTGAKEQDPKHPIPKSPLGGHSRAGISHPLPSSGSSLPGNGKTQKNGPELPPDHTVNEYKLLLREIARELSRLADFLKETRTSD